MTLKCEPIFDYGQRPVAWAYTDHGYNQGVARAEDWNLELTLTADMRLGLKHFTSSKLMCWVAADRGARLARVRGDHDVATRWQAAANEIHADICSNALDERGVFTQHYQASALDASVLLPMMGFLPSDDPRIHATVLAIADDLPKMISCCVTGWKRPTMVSRARRVRSQFASSGLSQLLWTSANLVVRASCARSSFRI